MRKLISLTLCLIIVFCSFSFCFADFGTTDSSNLSTIKNLLSSGGAIYNFLNTISGRLYASNNSIAYWVKGIYDNTFLNGEGTLAQICNGAKTYLNSISSKMDTVNGNLAVISSKMPSTDIAGLLGYPVTSGGSTTWYPYLFHNQKSAAEWLSDLNTQNYFPFNASNGGFWNIGANGQATLYRVNVSNFPWQKILLMYMGYLGDMTANSYSYRWAADLNGYNSLQSLISFANPNSTVTFTPTSSTDGLYKYLNALNTPLARLGYILASDERIEAQDAAAPVEQAVVDDFIDPTGDASASTSDIGSIADLSAGYQQNFGSTASVTGIFNIFDSNNFGWFSSETAQQLDTTVQTRGSYYATPLLDKQLEEINYSLGVTNAD